MQKKFFKTRLAGALAVCAVGAGVCFGSLSADAQEVSKEAQSESLGGGYERYQ